MALKRILLIALASIGASTAPALASNAATIKGDNNTLIYQITAIKGKALIELPNGKRYVAKPGMKIAHGSKISVLENSVMQGFDIQNKCEVEYRECVDRALYRDQLCAGLTTADRRPDIIRPAGPAYIPQTVAAASVMSPTYIAPVVQGASFAPYLLGLGGSALLAAVIKNDDRDVNITNNNSDSNVNDNDGGNNANDNNNSGGNNDNNGGNNANDNNNSGGNNDNNGGNNANDNNNSGGNNDNNNSGGSNSNNDDDDDGKYLGEPGDNSDNDDGKDDNDGGNSGGNNDDGKDDNDGGNSDGNNDDGKDDNDGGNSGGNNGNGGGNNDGKDLDDDGKPVSH